MSSPGVRNPSFVAEARADDEGAGSTDSVSGSRRTDRRRLASQLRPPPRGCIERTEAAAMEGPSRLGQGADRKVR